MSLKDILESMSDKPIKTKINSIVIDSKKLIEYKQEKQSLLPSYFKGWLNKIPKAERILDFGCALGYTTVWLNENKGTTVGLDDDPIVIKKAKELHNYEHFYCDSYKKLNFKENNFDVVFCYDALKNELNIAQTLSEIYRTLKVNGTFIFIMPIYSVVKEIGLYNWMPTIDEMKTVLTKARFKILDSEQIDTLSFGMVVTQSNNQMAFIKAVK